MKLIYQPRRMTPAALRAAHDGNAKNFMAAITPGGIEAQEKAGQLEQAAAQTLPLELGKDARKPWEALGFRFGKAADEVFVECIFPSGWKKETTEHSMWSDILDAKGRKRGSIFYKAAFYDRRAHASLARRFGVAEDYDSDPRVIRITDACGEVKKSITGVTMPKGDQAAAQLAYSKNEAARRELDAWLDANYPEWNDPLAYWPPAP